MKRLALWMLALAMLFAVAGAEEMFVEESFQDSANTADEFFAEESFFGDAFVAEGEEEAADAEEIDERSVYLFEEEVRPDELADWQKNYTIEIKGANADGEIAATGKKFTLEWTLNKATPTETDPDAKTPTTLKAEKKENKLLKNLKYYVYEVNPVTGVPSQKKVVTAEKMKVTVKNPGDYIYFVRLEDDNKKTKVEHLGVPSNEVTVNVPVDQKKDLAVSKLKLSALYNTDELTSAETPFIVSATLTAKSMAEKYIVNVAVKKGASYTGIFEPTEEQKDEMRAFGSLLVPINTDDADIAWDGEIVKPVLKAGDKVTITFQPEGGKAKKASVTLKVPKAGKPVTVSTQPVVTVKQVNATQILISWYDAAAANEDILRVESYTIGTNLKAPLKSVKAMVGDEEGKHVIPSWEKGHYSYLMTVGDIAPKKAKALKVTVQANGIGEKVKTKKSKAAKVKFLPASQLTIADLAIEQKAGGNVYFITWKSFNPAVGYFQVYVTDSEHTNEVASGDIAVSEGVEGKFTYHAIVADRLTGGFRLSATVKAVGTDHVTVLGWDKVDTGDANDSNPIYSSSDINISVKDAKVEFVDGKEYTYDEIIAAAKIAVTDNKGNPVDAVKAITLKAIDGKVVEEGTTPAIGAFGVYTFEAVATKGEGENQVISDKKTFTFTITKKIVNVELEKEVVELTGESVAPTIKITNSKDEPVTGAEYKVTILDSKNKPVMDGENPATVIKAVGKYFIEVAVSADASTNGAINTAEANAEPVWKLIVKLPFEVKAKALYVLLKDGVNSKVVADGTDKALKFADFEFKDFEGNAVDVAEADVTITIKQGKKTVTEVKEPGVYAYTVVAKKEGWIDGKLTFDQEVLDTITAIEFENGSDEVFSENPDKSPIDVTTSMFAYSGTGDNRAVIPNVEFEIVELKKDGAAVPPVDGKLLIKEAGAYTATVVAKADGFAPSEPIELTFTVEALLKMTVKFEGENVTDPWGISATPVIYDAVKHAPEIVVTAGTEEPVVVTPSKVLVYKHITIIGEDGNPTGKLQPISEANVINVGEYQFEYTYEREDYSDVKASISLRIEKAPMTLAAIENAAVTATYTGSEIVPALYKAQAQLGSPAALSDITEPVEYTYKVEKVDGETVPAGTPIKDAGVYTGKVSAKSDNFEDAPAVNFEFTVEPATLTYTIANPGAKVDLFGKKVADIQTKVAFSADKKITGTSKWISGWTDFSSNPDEQKGNYLAATITVNGILGEDEVSVSFGKNKPGAATLTAAAKSEDWVILLAGNEEKELNLAISNPNYAEIKDTFTFADLTLTPEPTFTAAITPTADTAKLFGDEKASDFQSEIAIAEDGKITGTSKWIASYPDFSSNVEEQSGHYLVLSVAVADLKKDEIATVTFGHDQPAKVELTASKKSEDFIFRLDANTAKTLELSIEREGYATFTKVYDFSGLTLAMSEFKAIAIAADSEGTALPTTVTYSGEALALSNYFVATEAAATEGDPDVEVTNVNFEFVIAKGEETVTEIKEIGEYKVTVTAKKAGYEDFTTAEPFTFTVNPIAMVLVAKSDATNTAEYANGDEIQLDQFTAMLAVEEGATPTVEVEDAVITYTVLDADGEPTTDKIINPGTYSVKATATLENYTTATSPAFTFTVTKRQLALTLIDGVTSTEVTAVASGTAVEPQIYTGNYKDSADQNFWQTKLSFIYYASEKDGTAITPEAHIMTDVGVYKGYIELDAGTYNDCVELADTYGFTVTITPKYTITATEPDPEEDTFEGITVGQLQENFSIIDNTISADLKYAEFSTAIYAEPMNHGYYLNATFNLETVADGEVILLTNSISGVTNKIISGDAFTNGSVTTMMYVGSEPKDEPVTGTITWTVAKPKPNKTTIHDETNNYDYYEDGDFYILSTQTYSIEVNLEANP